MDELTYTLRVLCHRNRDGSHATQVDRLRTLTLASRQLRTAGFRQMRASSLKGKHVSVLLERWQAEGLSAGTLKNRVAHLRWWAEKVGKAGVIPADNAQLAIPPRQFVTNEDKSQRLDDRLERISDPYIRMSLTLQQAFGLRREESIKFQPRYADRGNCIVLKGSWTKRTRPHGADYHGRATHRPRPRPSPRRGRVAHPLSQVLHPATPYVRRTVQGGRLEPHARLAAPLRPSPV
jgi:Phage integrase, N-terminal